MATILEALQNADFNLRNNGIIGETLAKDQLHNAVVLLEKGYTVNDEIEPFLEQYKDIGDVPENKVKDSKDNNNLVREQLANYAHESWSGWMKYMFGKSIPYKPEKIQAEEGALIIPKWAVDRWTYQMNRVYNELPEDMKETDRKEADKILEIIGKEL